MNKCHVPCATPCKVKASTDKNCGNGSKNRTTNEIGKVRVFLQHPLLTNY